MAKILQFPKKITFEFDDNSKFFVNTLPITNVMEVKIDGVTIYLPEFTPVQFCVKVN
jgi:hypothetical protein